MKPAVQVQLKGLQLEKITWFPGHMYRAMKLMDDYSNKVDIFLEMRDSRAPISSKNDEFDSLILKAQKQKIIIFNKFDLCNQNVT